MYEAKQVIYQLKEMLVSFYVVKDIAFIIMI